VPWSFGDCELDPDRLELRRGGKPVEIQPKPLEFLFYLVRNRERAVSKRELLGALWPDTAVTENSLARVASLARLAIGDRDGGGERIRTLQRRGYRFEGEVEAKAAERTPALAGGAAKAARPPADPFVGREALLDALDRAWASAEGGVGQIVLLHGEPGIGKTRTAAELAAHVRGAGGSVAVGRCPAARGAPAFWPWVQVLRELVTEEHAAELRARLGAGAALVAPLLPALRTARDDAGLAAAGEAERFLLCDGVASLLAHVSRERPLLLWLDDLQWADAPSLVLLRHLPGALRAARAMLVATVRADDPDATPELAGALADLARADACTQLRLEGLTLEEVERFLEARGRKDVPPEVVAVLHARTSGNPFFLRELVGWLEQTAAFDAADRVATVESALPPGVRDVIGSRVARAGEPCRRALAVAAQIGREFDVPLLEHAAGIPRAELLAVLDEAAALHLAQPLRERPGRFAFEHELVREVIAGAATGGVRARIHRRIGLAFEALHGHEPEPPLEALAHHFHLASSAGEERRALEYALRGAAAANAVLAFEDAAGHYERALRALELLGGGAEELPGRAGEKRLALLLQLTEARLRSGSVAATREAALRAADAARALGDADGLVQAALGYGGLALWGVPASPERRALLEEALAAVGPAPSPARARVLARLIAERPDADARAGAEPLAAEAVAIARRLGDPECLAEALHARHFVLQGPDHLAERFACAREVLAIGGKPELAWAIRENLAADLLMRGDAEGCRQELARARAEARALRNPAFLWLTEGTHASLALLEGRLDEAERLAYAALALGRRTANPNAEALFVGQVHLLARERGTQAALAATVSGHVTQLAWVGTYARVGLATLLFDLGRRDEARGALRVLAAHGFAALPRRDDWLASIVELAALCAGLGEREHAAELEPLLTPFLGWHAVYQGPLLYHGPVSRALAHLAAAQGRRADARNLFSRARAEAASVGAAPWVARIEAERS
jgi:DNA-binding winged helix-turn-helix (wHTH) protein